MKILHITNNYPTKNYPIFGIFVKEQIESLNEIGIDNDVFFINGREYGKLEYLKSIFKLRSYLKKKSYDIVHCHHVYSAIVFILTGYYKKISSIVSFQNDPAKESKLNLFPFVKNKVTGWIFKNNSNLVDNVKGFYLPNGVDIDFFRPIPKIKACQELNLEATKKYILFVSSNFIRPQKRYDIFQSVITELKKSDPTIEELKLINVKRELVPYYFNAASVHLLTSDFEGSPNSVKEAMSCNVPVVSTNAGNVSDLLQNVHGSFVSTTNNVEELTELVRKALSLNISDGRENLIKDGFDKYSVATKLVNIYFKNNE